MTGHCRERAYRLLASLRAASILDMLLVGGFICSILGLEVCHCLVGWSPPAPASIQARKLAGMIPTAGRIQSGVLHRFTFSSPFVSAILRMTQSGSSQLIVLKGLDWHGNCIVHMTLSLTALPCCLTSTCFLDTLLRASRHTFFVTRHKALCSASMCGRDRTKTVPVLTFSTKLRRYSIGFPPYEPHTSHTIPHTWYCPRQAGKVPVHFEL